ncbi:uracil-DNA glycosylase [Alterisphingorhabdus coralli]|uniref:Type-5 uracil-DNA glycosylase n=1 Tax=Alterisphingorhabdus coralli TaxID=3071408 RepID=A0AA97F8X8_9SPHN|nr:uracil-DNA glycosylase [Parasphingorhabdus sp. SCSIO 66989]WOE74650.1 uracil-DNA glycosylase [Parasphingorhabdus sp. SCSIO 66989]
MSDTSSFSVLPKGAAPANCRRCPRLVALRRETRKEHPDWWNRPVPAWGDPDAWLVVVGLAPGMQGAHRTGRAFTGDASGIVLHAALARQGLSNGLYDARADDGLVLHGVAIANVIQCLPPQNKPLGAEVAKCSRYFAKTLNGLPKAKVLLALGSVAHKALVRDAGLLQKDVPFAHGAQYPLPDGRWLVSSYHCSRYNMNTGRLTEGMLDDVLRQAQTLIA